MKSTRAALGVKRESLHHGRPVLLDIQDINRVNSKAFTELFKGKTRIEASYKVFSQATYYPNYTKIYTFKNPIDKLLPYMEGTDTKPKKKTSARSNGEDFERSIRRSKRRIKDYVLCNDFELFCTFTFKDNRQNIDRCKSKMSDWLRNQQKRTGKFKYLIVPEFHKDGVSLHFHALIAGYKGVLINSGKRINGREAYNLKSYTLGINSVVKIDNREKVAAYVTKYITKDMPIFWGKHRFWSSNDLVLPTVEDNPKPWYQGKTPLWSKENDYGITAFYEREA